MSDVTESAPAETVLHYEPPQASAAHWQLAPVASKLDYAQPPKRPRAHRGRWWLIGILVCIALSWLAAPVALRRLRPPHSNSDAIMCAMNLKAVGLGLMMYANDHNGYLPGSFEDLLANDPNTGSEFFVCPHGNCTAARGPTTQATLDQFARPGHCSYIYLGRGLKWTDDPKVILAYEPLADHGDGMNVLFGDGHAEYLKAPGVLPSIHWNERPVMQRDGKD